MLGPRPPQTTNPHESALKLFFFRKRETTMAFNFSTTQQNADVEPTSGGGELLKYASTGKSFSIGLGRPEDRRC